MLVLLLLLLLLLVRWRVDGVAAGVKKARAGLRERKTAT
jgi:hypothetical protein